MSFKTNFFAMGTSQDDRELDQAIAVCDRIGAHLSVLVLGVASPPPASPYGVMASDLWAVEIDEGQKTARARADRVSARIAEHGLASGSVEAMFIETGAVPTLAARQARYADLTLVARDQTSFRSGVINGALFESGRPVLLLPEKPSRFPELGRVLIAWDASVEASKAVRDAIGLMKTAKFVDAVLIDPVPSFEGHGAEPGADLATYLARHGIATTIHRLPREGQEVADILCRTATDLEADLIVMGGFGHSRLREWFFGGCTSMMLKQAPVPVLMAH